MPGAGCQMPGAMCQRLSARSQVPVFENIRENPRRSRSGLFKNIIFGSYLLPSIDEMMKLFRYASLQRIVGSQKNFQVHTPFKAGCKVQREVHYF